MPKEPEEQIPASEVPLEIVLRGTPSIISPLIKTNASELRINGYRYIIRTDPDEAQTDSFMRFTVTVSNVGRTYPVGVISLQLLPDNLTLFRVPPHSNWGHVGEYAFDAEGSYFNELLTKLFYEFNRLGFVDFKKPRLGFSLPYLDRSDI